MARQALIIGEVTDAWGDRWDLRERRPTRHGFDLCFGWPAGVPRGRGGAGAPRAILMAELVEHMERHRLRPGEMDLPLSINAIKRLRRLLGHNRYIDRAAWWEERADELADLTVEAFASRYGVSAGAVINARHAFLGRQLRPAGWWRAPDVAEIMLSDLPRAEIADTLGISVGAVGRLRWMLRPRAIPDHPRSQTGREAVKARRDAALELYRQGLSTAEVARTMGVSRFTAENDLAALRKQGHTITVAQRRGRRRRGQLQAEVRELNAAGLTPREIAQQLGTTLGNVKQALRRIGAD